jgi:hypothetical protein
MGFIAGFGRFLAGKPIYQATTPPATEPGHPAEPTHPVTALGLKTIPIVRIGRVECHPSGNVLNVYADIHNESNEPIFLDSILMAGAKRELDNQLRGGESRQFQVYSGPHFMTPPSGYAEVRYRKQSDGDYFADYHEIRTRQEGAMGYIITELLQRGPVKDI